MVYLAAVCAQPASSLPNINSRMPALILGGGGAWGLGIFRSLGRLGVPLYLATSRRSGTLLYSRYCKGRVVPSIYDYSEETVPILLAAAQKMGKCCLLIPTTDETAIFVAKNHKALSESYVFPQQTSQLVNSLCSKKELYHIAKKFSVPTPEAAFPQSRAELLDFLEIATFPLMMKTVRHNGPYSVDKAIVHSISQLIQQYEQMAINGNTDVMLQEFIPGGDKATWMFDGYFDEDSTPLFDATGRKLRQWRRYHGITTLGISLKNDRLADLAKGFMQGIRYRGIVDMDYIYDSRDKQYKLLDVNPRIGASFRLFVDSNGMDVARVLYFDLSGQKFLRGAAVAGRKWLVEDLDIASSALYFLEGKMTLREWLGSYRKVRESAYFARDDPLPFFKMWANNAKRFSYTLETMLQNGNRTK